MGVNANSAPSARWTAKLLTRGGLFFAITASLGHQEVDDDLDGGRRSRVPTVRAMEPAQVGCLPVTLTLEQFDVMRVLAFAPGSAWTATSAVPTCGVFVSPGAATVPPIRQ